MDTTRWQAVNLEAGRAIGRGPMNTFTRIPVFPPAGFRNVVYPIFDTLYSIAWLDLTKEPMVVGRLRLSRQAHHRHRSSALVGLGANLPEDAVYPLNIGDSADKPLNGANNYILRFAKNEITPVKAFWSVTLYDKEGFPSPNRFYRSAIGDRNSLRFNEDGSLDIHIQHASPGAEKETNWLPRPADAIDLTMRLYSPKTRVPDGNQAPPAIKRID